MVHISSEKRALLLSTTVVLTAVIAIPLFLSPTQKAEAGRIIVKDGDLYSLSNTFGEKKLTTKKDIKVLFEQKKGKILFGQGWEGDLGETIRTGGTHLFAMNEDGSQMQQLTNEPVIGAFLDPKGNDTFYTTNKQVLYKASNDGKNAKKIQEKVLSANLSPDGSFLVYQKLNPDWQLGNYYDQALGLTLLDLETMQEKRISQTPDDFNPFWTPDGQKILFFSASPEGLASHFIMNPDGSERRQLTNIGQKFVNDQTVANPSEMPIWSSDGKYFVYEADKKIWINEFDKNYNMVRGEAISYGTNPQWIEEGKTLSVVVAPGTKAFAPTLTIDVNGKIMK